MRVSLFIYPSGGQLLFVMDLILFLIILTLSQARCDPYIHRQQFNSEIK